MATKAKQIEELTKQRNKVIVDLVELAVEFRRLKEGLSVHSSALGNYVTVSAMCDQIIETFTKNKESEES